MNGECNATNVQGKNYNLHKLQGGARAPVPHIGDAVDILLTSAGPLAVLLPQLANISTSSCARRHAESRGRISRPSCLEEAMISSYHEHLQITAETGRY